MMRTEKSFASTWMKKLERPLTRTIRLAHYLHRFGPFCMSNQGLCLVRSGKGHQFREPAILQRHKCLHDFAVPLTPSNWTNTNFSCQQQSGRVLDKSQRLVTRQQTQVGQDRTCAKLSAIGIVAVVVGARAPAQRLGRVML